MRFWDASAIVPLVLEQPGSERVTGALQSDPRVIVWWATRVESESAIARLEREQKVTGGEADDARALLSTLVARWNEVEPSDECRERATLLLRRYALRAGDALQLAAALVWTDGRPRGHAICTTDNRFAEVARREGFALAL